MPRSVLEASAMGIPCLVSDVPGCRDVIKDGITGFILLQEIQMISIRKL